MTKTSTTPTTLAINTTNTPNIWIRNVLTTSRATKLLASLSISKPNNTPMLTLMAVAWSHQPHSATTLSPPILNLLAQQLARSKPWTHPLLWSQNVSPSTRIQKLVTSPHEMSNDESLKVSNQSRWTQLMRLLVIQVRLDWAEFSLKARSQEMTPKPWTEVKENRTSSQIISNRMKSEHLELRTHFITLSITILAKSSPQFRTEREDYTKIVKCLLLPKSKIFWLISQKLTLLHLPSA